MPPLVLLLLYSIIPFTSAQYDSPLPPTISSNSNKSNGTLAKPPIGAPAHDPVAYAAKNGLTLETDEEGNYRIGLKAEEGYESLYVEETLNSSSTPTTLVPDNDQHNKNGSRADRNTMNTVRVGRSHDSGEIVMEGSGVDVQSGPGGYAAMTSPSPILPFKITNRDAEAYTFVFNRVADGVGDPFRKRSNGLAVVMIDSTQPALSLPTSNYAFRPPNRQNGQHSLEGLITNTTTHQPEKPLSTHSLVRWDERNGKAYSKVKVMGTTKKWSRGGTSMKGLHRGNGFWRAGKRKIVRSRRVPTIVGRKHFVTRKVSLDRTITGLVHDYERRKARSRLESSQKQKERRHYHRVAN